MCEEDVLDYHLQQLQEWGEACEAEQSSLLVGPRHGRQQPLVDDQDQGGRRLLLAEDDLLEDDIPAAASLIGLLSDLVPHHSGLGSIVVNRSAKILIGKIVQDILEVN